MKQEINMGSFAWKSILKGRDIILRGMKWRVGDGWSIKILRDQWLPSVGSSRVLSPPPPLKDHDPEMKVANLIDHEQRCWRTKIIDGMFLPFEVNVIKAIPLSLVDTPNWIYWSKNRNGVYFVNLSTN